MKDVKDYLDVALGKSFQEKRLAAGITGCEMATLLNIKQPQIAKMEAGIHSISAARLYRASKYTEYAIGEYFAPVSGVFDAKDKVPEIILSNIKLVRQLSLKKQQGLSAILKELVKT